MIWFLQHKLQGSNEQKGRVRKQDSSRDISTNCTYRPYFDPGKKKVEMKHKIMEDIWN